MIRVIGDLNAYSVNKGLIAWFPDMIYPFSHNLHFLNGNKGFKWLSSVLH